MKKVFKFICLSFLIITLAGCSANKLSKTVNISSANSEGDTVIKTDAPVSSNVTEDQNTNDQEEVSNDEKDTEGTLKVKIYLIGLDDNGKSGKRIDTGDSIIPVDVPITSADAPLSAALNKLLSIKEQYYGQSGLYNSIYRSNLVLDKAVIKDGEAEIRLSGDLLLGGEMDNPRVKAQLEETALQFDTVKKVSIYINNKKLEDLLSGKSADSQNSILYTNTQYGFSFSLPESWKGYSIVDDKWEGVSLESENEGKVVETGPLLSIRHPQWTVENPRQDIPIMIFTLDQWNSLQQEKFHIGAAPVNPSELGRNSKYVFALPARYNFAFLEGFEEVENILNGNPLHTTE